MANMNASAAPAAPAAAPAAPAGPTRPRIGLARPSMGLGRPGMARPSMRRGMMGGRMLSADMVARRSSSMGVGVARPMYRSLGMVSRPTGVDPFAQPKPVYRSISVGAPAVAAGGARPGWSLPAKEATYRSLSVAPVKPLSPSPFAYVAPAAPKPALSSSAVSPPAPLLPPAPFALEKFTSFEVTQPSTSTTDAVVQQLRAALAAAGAQSEYNARKHKFKGMAFDQGNFNAVRFTVRVYRTSNAADQRHVVEFQRRAGCCMSWLGFYDQVVAQCDALNEDLAATARDRAEKRGRRTAAACDADAADADADAADAGLSVLADMATCDFAESRLEACRSLALLTARGPTARAVARHQRCRTATLSLLRSADGDVQRCAVAAVANVLEAATHEHETEDDRAVFAQLRLDVVQPMVAATAATTPRGSGHLVETRRHAVRALAALVRDSPDAAGNIAAAAALTPDAAAALRRMAAGSSRSNSDGEWQKNCWDAPRRARGASDDAAVVLQHCGM